jgi:serine/threonine protein kinase
VTRVPVHDELEETLKQIQTNIEILKKTNGLLESHQLQEGISRFRGKYVTPDPLGDFFCSKIMDLDIDDRRGSFSIHRTTFKIQFGKLLWFWRRLPQISELSRGVTWPEPVDGVIISEEHVIRAKSVLCRFRDAWYKVNESKADATLDEPRLNSLEHMARIALTLWVTRRHHLFNKFLEADIRDSDMDRDPYQEDIVGEDYHYIGSQYSRVCKRMWNDGDHLTLATDEPLPLRATREPIPGVFSTVQIVRDLWEPDKEYAQKEMTTKAEAKEHIKNEIKTLKSLCKEDHGHHFVRYVKSYERGDVIGVLLQPVARENLNRLLLKCCSSTEERQKNAPTLLRAFGCLTYSLCYLHNIMLYRHRDVKPHNILCLDEEFMWSDFGLAYDFSAQSFSGTQDPFFQATEDYEAPEIDRSASSYHGRSADVFSFGCLFLEIISVLMIPPGKIHQIHPFRCNWPYKKNIPKMVTWIAEMTEELKKRKEKTLRKVLELCDQMIKKDPKQRPKIGAVALALMDIKEGDRHPFCKRCVAKYKIDKSKTPKHRQIFVHQKVNWPKQMVDWWTQRGTLVSLGSASEARGGRQSQG